MKLHTPAHKHVGDAGKPGQIVNAPTTGRMVSSTPNIQQLPLNMETARMLSDLMRKQGMQVDMGLKLAAELQAKTHG